MLIGVSKARLCCCQLSLSRVIERTYCLLDNLNTSSLHPIRHVEVYRKCQDDSYKCNMRAMNSLALLSRYELVLLTQSTPRLQ